MKKYTSEWLAYNNLTEGWHEKQVEWLEKVIAETKNNVLKIAVPVFYMEAFAPVICKYKFTSIPNPEMLGVILEIFLKND